MEPTLNIYDPKTNLTSRILKLVAIAIGVILIGYGVYAVYLTVSFRLTSTSPLLSKVSNLSPFIKFTFNHPLSQTGLNVGSSPAIIKTTSINGKTLTISFNTSLKTGQSYEILLNSVSDTTGKVITGKNLAFKPQKIPFSNLSTDQKQTILNNADNNQPYSIQSLSFDGAEALLNQGLTNNQLTNTEAAFFNYFTTSKQTIRKITITASTITTDSTGTPNNPSPDQTMTFSGTFDDTTAFQAKITYAITDPIDLIIINPQTGATIFDSGIIGGSSSASYGGDD